MNYDHESSLDSSEISIMDILLELFWAQLRLITSLLVTIPRVKSPRDSPIGGVLEADVAAIVKILGPDPLAAVFSKSAFPCLNKRMRNEVVPSEGNGSSRLGAALVADLVTIHRGRFRGLHSQSLACALRASILPIQLQPKKAQ